MRYGPHGHDDLEVGQTFEADQRVVERETIATFAEISGDHTPLHTDETYAAQTAFGGIVAHGCLTLAIATGQVHSMHLFEETVLAFRGLEVSFDRPVKPGDTLDLTLTVEELDARPRADRGRARFRVEQRNQEGRVVLSGHWNLLLRRRAP